MPAKVEAFIRNKGLKSFYTLLDTPKNNNNLRSGNVFEINGLQIDPHSLGLVFYGLLKNSSLYEKERETILNESGVDPRFLGLACNAIANGTLGKIRKEITRQDLNITFLYLCTFLPASGLRTLVERSDWGTNQRIKETFTKLRRFTTEKKYKRLNIRRTHFKKKTTLGSFVVRKGQRREIIRRVRNGEDLRNIVQEYKFSDRNWLQQILNRTRSFNLPTNGLVTQTEQIENLLQEIDRETDHQKVAELLSQVGWGTVRSQTKKGGPIIYIKSILSEAGINPKKILWHYQGIVTALDQAKIGVGLLRQDVNVNRNSGPKTYTQKVYIVRRKDGEKAIEAIKHAQV